MTNYNGPERRKISLGMSKESFMDNVAQAFGNKAKGVFGAIYDFHMCQDTKMQLINDKVNEIAQKCTCRLDQCEKNYDLRYVKRTSEKIPVSLFSLIGIVAVVFFLAGLGVLDLTGIIDIKAFIKHIIV